MQYPTLHDAIARMRLSRVQQEGGLYKDVLVFREHFTTVSALYGKEVPRTEIATDSIRPDYFYFCGTYALQFSKYQTFFDMTRNHTNSQVQAFSTQDLDIEFKNQEIQIRSYTSKGTEPYTSGELVKMRYKCIRDMLYSGVSETHVETLFSLSPFYVNKLLKEKKVPLPKERKQGCKNDTDRKKGVSKDARYKLIAKMLIYTRTKAHKTGVYGEFKVLDVFPNMYSVHGNVGAQNGDLFIPNMCPVLRIPLAWEGDNNAMSAPRVWRKTNTKPFGPDNVTIMSKLAAWLIEGAYGKNRVEGAMDHAMHEAWRDWQARHPFRPA